MNKKNTSLKIKPLQDKVVLKEISTKDTKTASGIIIPESANSEKDTKKAEVVAVGSGKIVDGKTIKPEVSVGDKVLYSWGDEVVIEGEKFIITSIDNISAIIY